MQPLRIAEPSGAPSTTPPASADVVATVPFAPDMPGVDQVAQAVQTLLATPRMRTSPQLCRFFEYVATESLDGRGAKLKAFTIATAALGRPVEFDPSRDPIVRVEATRLRAVLAAYYADEGRFATVRIRIPPGSYQPVADFLDESTVEPVVAEPAAAPAAVAAAPARSERTLYLLAGAALAAAIVNAIALTIGAVHLADLSRMHEVPGQAQEIGKGAAPAADLTGSVVR